MIHAKYLNRELSWLEFNQRVLEEALDAAVPLLERVKFLAITASNLDEFFRVRVGGLQLLVERGATRTDASGMTPEEQLAAVAQRVARMTADQYACLEETLEPQLREAGIRRLAPRELTVRQYDIARQIFDNEIYSVLTPIAVRESAEFPLLPNQVLSLCVRLAPDGDAPDEPRFAVIPLPGSVSRFVSVPVDDGYGYLLLEDLVTEFIDQVFVGEVVDCTVPFRITRNADISVQEDSAADLLAEMEQVLSDRRHGDCVRLEVAQSGAAAVREFLASALHVGPERVVDVPGPVDLSAWFSLSSRQGFHQLKADEWPPLPSMAAPRDRSMFEVIASGDLLLVHPYESFEPVVRFVEEAAADPEVLTIKQVLYRTSRDSPIVAALQRAAEAGKHVTAIVELKARFDEARNIAWARRLEHAGAQVIYGVKALKTHAKACLVVRREPHGIQRYVHFGTGNYNESTAKIYSDVSLLTADPDLGADAAAFFNAITGYSQPQKYRKIAAAPIDLRDRLLEMIRVEIARANDGLPARITAKLNALVDTTLIDALYEASEAGVDVQLNVRGICCLRPGVPKLSERIEVVSIVDRFLEHARIIRFEHGGDPRLFISSADWMPRNLDRRVELLVPVDDPECQRRLTDVLETYFEDNVKARRLKADGGHERPAVGRGPRVRAQEALYQRFDQAVRDAQRNRITVFEPHLPEESST